MSLRKLPKKLKIGAIVWKVIEVNPSEIDCDDGSVNGDQSHATQTIRINRGMSLEMKWATLFHEVLHCIDVQLDHDLVELLSQGYYQVLRENNLLK